MSFSFSPQHETRFTQLKTRYPTLRALMLPSLWMAQHQEGWVSPDAITYIASRLAVSDAEVLSVASFYTMLQLKPIGKHHIQVCKTLSCMLGGAESLVEFLHTKLGIVPGETTKDGRFTLTQVECLGACGGAPCICIDETYHECVSKATLETLLKELEQ
jgi:NADH-quinone oxidoreductase subunit E